MSLDQPGIAAEHPEAVINWSLLMCLYCRPVWSLNSLAIWESFVVKAEAFEKFQLGSTKSWQLLDLWKDMKGDGTRTQQCFLFHDHIFLFHVVFFRLTRPVLLKKLLGLGLGCNKLVAPGLSCSGFRWIVLRHVSEKRNPMKYRFWRLGFSFRNHCLFVCYGHGRAEKHL